MTTRGRRASLLRMVGCLVSKACPNSKDPGLVAHEAPLSMGFSRQEYQRGLPWPPPGDLPDPGFKPASLPPPALVGGFFTTESPGSVVKKNHLGSSPSFPGSFRVRPEPAFPRDTATAPTLPTWGSHAIIQTQCQARHMCLCHIKTCHVLSSHGCSHSQVLISTSCLPGAVWSPGDTAMNTQDLCSKWGNGQYTVSPQIIYCDKR